MAIAYKWRLLNGLGVVEKEISAVDLQEYVEWETEGKIQILQVRSAGN